MQSYTAPHTQLSRRRILALAAAMAGGAALAACGNLGATETPQAAVSNPPPAARTSGAAYTTAAMPAPAIAPATGSITASGTQSGGQTLVIEAFDFGYKTMGTVPGGITTVRMTNTGQDAHHTQFMLLNEGVTFEQFTAALQKGPGAAFALASMAGGPGLAAPNGTAEVMLDLQPGQYAIACFAQGADHVPHLAKGMVMPLTVTAPMAAPVAFPATAGTVTLYDFSFEMPATLPAGKNLYRVVNGGAQFHEFTVIQIAPGKTLADVKAFFDPPPGAAAGGPPPGLPLGGMNALGKGTFGIAVLDLPPGDYAAICNVPDQSKPNGDSHLHLGMMKSFTVT